MIEWPYLPPLGDKIGRSASVVQGGLGNRFRRTRRPLLILYWLWLAEGETDVPMINLQTSKVLFRSSMSVVSLTGLCVLHSVEGISTGYKWLWQLRGSAYSCQKGLWMLALACLLWLHDITAPKRNYIWLEAGNIRFSSLSGGLVA